MITVSQRLYRLTPNHYELEEGLVTSYLDNMFECFLTIARFCAHIRVLAVQAEELRDVDQVSYRVIAFLFCVASTLYDVMSIISYHQEFPIYCIRWAEVVTQFCHKFRKFFGSLPLKMFKESTYT